MGGRLGGVFGWAGILVMAWGVYLAGVGLFGTTPGISSEALALSLILALLLALVVGGFAITGPLVETPADPERRPEPRRICFRASGALIVLILAVWAFPSPNALLAVRGDRNPLPPGTTIELWFAICVIALGLALLVGSSERLQVRKWKPALLGAVAAGLVVVLIANLIPVLTRALTVEHSLAAEAGEPAPIPTDVTQVGWTWQPDQPVVDAGRGSLGPVLRLTDGLVALEGETGAVLWSYRISYTRDVRAGFFEGNEEYAYLTYPLGSGPKDRALVVLDTATGEVVRETRGYDLDEDSPGQRLHLTPHVELFRVDEDGEPTVVAVAIDSKSPGRPGKPGGFGNSGRHLWEFPLTDTSPGRTCVHVGDNEVQGYGERLLLTRVCLDEEHIPEGDEAKVREALSELAVPVDALRTLIVLDTATGEELWHHEETPESLYGTPNALIRTPRAGGGGPVVENRGDLLDLETGDPVDVLPEVPEDPDDPDGPKRIWDTLLAADTDGAIVLRSHHDSDTTSLLRTDSGGEVVVSVEFEQDVADGYLSPDRSYSAQGGDQFLVGGLVTTRFRQLDRSGKANRAVLTIPVGEGTAQADEGDPLSEFNLDWIRFRGEEISSGRKRNQGRLPHRTLAAPGVVISYVEGSTAEGPAPVHGLVP